jgi:hypothetical protein
MGLPTPANRPLRAARWTNASVGKTLMIAPKVVADKLPAEYKS